MFALVAANFREARYAMERLEEQGVFDPANRARAKREVTVVTPLTLDNARGITFEDGAFVDGWCRAIPSYKKHDIIAQLELSGLRECGTVYL